MASMLYIVNVFELRIKRRQGSFARPLRDVSGEGPTPMEQVPGIGEVLTCDGKGSGTKLS